MAHSYDTAEHDATNSAKRVNVVSGTITASSQVTVTLNNTPTIYAVVNTAVAGQASIVLDNSTARIGFATVNVVAGFLGLNAGVQQIGSVTVSNLAPWSGYTVFTGTYSASGFNTVFVPQNNTHFYIKDLLLSSQATAYVGFKSGATNTPLMTSMLFNPAGGFMGNFGDAGLRSLATNDALILDLQGGATVALMANVRFGN